MKKETLKDFFEEMLGNLDLKRLMYEHGLSLHYGPSFTDVYWHNVTYTPMSHQLPEKT